MKRIAICFLLFINSLVFAQTGTIKGVALDNSGKSAAFVNIKLKEINLGTNSNQDGLFEFDHLNPQNYTLEASFVGYKTLVQPIKVEADKTLNITLQLVENTEMLKEIVVKGFVTQNERAVSLAKIAIKPMDLPQSIMTIDHAILENQQVANMSDILANTNGVYIMGTSGGYQEEIAGRGFAFGSSNTFKNGVRYFNGMIGETSGLERVEIMKGSTAILFGNVAAGGILNLVTKKPKFDFGGELDFKMGSFGLYKPMFDVYGSLNKSKKVAFRINGTYEKSNSFRVGVSSKRYYINPSLLFKIGNKTELLLESDYLNDNRTADFGVGIINYQLIDYPREKFIGVPWGYFKSNQSSATATLTHLINENWKISFVNSYRNYATDLFANTRPNTGKLITADGTWIRNIQRTSVTDNYYLSQLDLTGQFKTGNLSHQALFGVETDKFNTNTTTYNQMMGYDTVNIFGTKKYSLRNDIPELSKATLTKAPINRFGIYAQDLLEINNYIKVLAGLRYTYQQTVSDILTYKTNTTAKSATYDGAFSPRFGLVLQPNANHSLFASYSNSFSLNTGVDTSGKALKPSIIDQYELGIKNDLINRKLSVNVTAYKILNKNMAQTSLANGNTNTNIKVLAGSVESKGVEVDLSAKPMQNLTVMAGYSYNETKYVKSNTFIEGSFLKYNPNHTANASINYAFNQGKFSGLNLGLIGNYIGVRYAGRSTRVQVENDVYNLVKIPEYFQLNAMASYSVNRFVIRAKLANVTNVLAYNVHDDNSVNPIAPRNYSLSIGLKL